MIRSYLQPIEKPVPMLATTDIGRVAAGLLRETWDGQRVVELEGSRWVAPMEAPGALSSILNHPVRIEPVPRESWEGFPGRRCPHPAPRVQMIDGFDEGWIESRSARQAPSS